MEVAERIKRLCAEHKISGVELGKILGLKKSPLTDWKNGQSKPTLEQISVMCDIFATSSDYILFGAKKEADKNLADELVPLSVDEKELLQAYRKIKNKRNETAVKSEVSPAPKPAPKPKKAAKSAAALSVPEPKSAPAPPTPVADDDEDEYDDYYNEEMYDDEDEEIIRLPIFSQSVSAGRGNYLTDEPDPETLKFRASQVPGRANFCMRVKGDSMEPEIEDDEIIFVESTPFLDSGEIGVFSLNNDLLCKKLCIDHKNRQLLLISLNPVYPTIEVVEGDTLFTWGRVLGSAPRRRV
jgi:phage repressor protein C with HTH and peptisase S24 domain